MDPMDRPVPAKADVSVRVPADSAYVSVLRTMTAGLAARLDFTVDDIEDLRIAVGEACALVLPEARTGADLEAEFRLTPGTLTISVQRPDRGPADRRPRQLRLAGAQHPDDAARARPATSRTSG